MEFRVEYREFGPRLCAFNNLYAPPHPLAQQSVTRRKPVTTSLGAWGLQKQQFSENMFEKQIEGMEV